MSRSYSQYHSESDWSFRASAILLFIVGLLYFLFYTITTETHTIVIGNTDVNRSGGLYISVQDTSTKEKMIVKVEDCATCLVFDSMEMHQKLRKDSVYVMTTVGLRMPLLRMYPILKSIETPETDL
jgi:hypothetical protein